MKEFYYTGLRQVYFYLIYLMALSYFKPPRLPFKKVPFFDIATIVKRNQGKFGIFYTEAWASQFFKAYLKNPKLLFQLSSHLKKEKARLFKKLKKQTGLTKLADQELLNLYQEVYDLMHLLVYANQVVWHLEVGGGKFLKERFAQQGLKEEKIFLATFPSQRNYLQQEELNFFKLCRQYFKNPDQAELASLLQKHLEKFAYVGISYFNEPPRQKQDYLKQIALFKRQGKDWHYFDKIIKEKEINFREKIQQRNKLVSCFKDYQVKKAVKILQGAVFLKDYFRGSLSECIHYYFNNILREIGSRLKIRKIRDDLIKSLKPNEIKNLLEGKKISWSEIRARQRLYASGVFDKKFFLIYGAKARAFEKKYFKQGEISSIKELRGISAQKGRARGRVKIILSFDDFKKFKKGDILVASNTMPEYMSIIKKARAIVTELGGLTCHAAIISRELDIPCVIGTKIATKVLRDGQLVEVDANKGIVRIIKYAK